MKGRVKIHEHDEISARLEEQVRAGHGMDFPARREQLAAVFFSIEEIYDQTPSLESAGKCIS
jgi:hypothetical protein